MIVLSLLVSRHVPVFAHGADGPGDAKRIHAVRVAQPPVLDGELSEEEWSWAQPVSDFFQREPSEGGGPTERTEVRILYTEDALFIGVWCYDSQPDAIRATERRRDSTMDGDDTFDFLLDPAHSHRNAYHFRINPLGTQWDRLVTDEGNANASWDGRWEVAARIHPWGWGAEIKMPFTTLRIPDREDSIWAIDFRRDLPRNNEVVIWSNYTRAFSFREISQGGHLTGLSGIARGLNLRIKPYVSTGTIGGAGGKPELEFGIEDVRYPITSRMNLNVTVNPDFAQADVDDFQINLTRFPLFFEEKREFFLEDAGMFEFGIGGVGRPDLRLLHTRQIGMTPDRRPLPILFGARLTEQTPNWSLGLMNVQTRHHEGLSGSHFGAYRLKRNLFARSHVGAMTTFVQNPDGENNGTLGIDAHFVVFRNLRLQSLMVRSASTGAEAVGWAAVPLWLAWNTDRWRLEGQQLVVGRDFRPEAGFVGRRDIRRSRLDANYKPRPDVRWIRQLDIGGRLTYLTDLDGTLRTRHQSVGFGTHLESGDVWQIGYTRNLEREDGPFRIAGRLPVAPGTYHNDEIKIALRSYRGRTLSGTYQIAWENFWSGNRTSITLSPTLRSSNRLPIDVSYRGERVSLPQGTFSSHIVRTRLELNVTNEWLTSTTVQYSHLDDEWGLNLRLRYIYRPGDNLFLVFNRTRSDADSGWSVRLKFTHTLGF